jgi:glycine/serine hydroxymethyltransferase
MKEEEMMAITDLIDKALSSGGDKNVLSEVRGEVKQLTSIYPLPG